MRCRADTVGLFLSFGFTLSPRAWNQNQCGLLWGQRTTERQLVCRWTGGEGRRIKRERRENNLLACLVISFQTGFFEKEQGLNPFLPRCYHLALCFVHSRLGLWVFADYSTAAGWSVGDKRPLKQRFSSGTLSNTELWDIFWNAFRIDCYGDQTQVFFCQ